MFQKKNGKGGTLTDVPMAAAELTEAAAIGQVVGAISFLDGAGFHGLDTAISGGEIPSGSIGKVKQAAAITAAVKWPAELLEVDRALAGNLKVLSAAIAAGNASAAADPAKAVHDGVHVLSRKVHAWLGEMGGDHGADASPSH